jgi:hypothetical protein
MCWIFVPERRQEQRYVLLMRRRVTLQPFIIDTDLTKKSTFL